MTEKPKKLVFATNNLHKLEEIRSLAGDKFIICSLAEIGCHEDIPETADTIRDNAIMKARYVAEKYGVDCFADDTGLEVATLGGAPGVHTARYASEQGHDTMANMKLLLRNMENAADRSARFVTWIALVEGGEVTAFEGVCNGTILEAMEGEGGFGYDPVFRPDGFDVTFASMTGEQKNEVSHRGKATRKLIDYLAAK
ncbi:MAG: non-canonical purine NTP diphosphatase [Bacteroidales bacterium]|nr:non-canonical purine NTP diphosphatase [Bacteroidales bacterium]MBD5247079.1 non-canonical purine NTP diphosphatase [Barnesiella sp.]